MVAVGIAVSRRWFLCVLWNRVGGLEGESAQSPHLYRHHTRPLLGT